MKFTAAQCRVIRKQYEAGELIVTLAREYDCCDETILSALRGAGGEIRSGRKFAVKQCRAIRGEYETGQSIGALARKYRCSPGAIRSAVEFAGGQLRSLAESSRERHKELNREYVEEAERLARRNGGMIPLISRLIKNGHSGLVHKLARNPEFFVHLKQERLKRTPIHSGLSETPEYRTVRGHHHDIFNSNSSARRNYRGMPFFDSWNPDKGGSWAAGAKWIIENLGKRPTKDSSLHIVKHEKGFVPGNLEWASKKKQSAEQMFKIIANQQNQIKRLKKQLRELREAA